MEGRKLRCCGSGSFAAILASSITVSVTNASEMFERLNLKMKYCITVPAAFVFQGLYLTE